MGGPKAATATRCMAVDVRQDFLRFFWIVVSGPELLRVSNAPVLRVQENIDGGGLREDAVKLDGVGLRIGDAQGVGLRIGDAQVLVSGTKLIRCG